MDQNALTAALRGRLGWYTRRLGSMSVPELMWRSVTVGTGMLPRRDIASGSKTAQLLANGDDFRAALDNFRASSRRPVLLDRARARAIASNHPEQVAALMEEAEQSFAGRVSYFGYPDAWLERPVDWNHDLISDFHWPKAPARSIDHRTAAADPKWIWELNRLQHLPGLAQAWLFTGEDRFADLALSQLDSWIVQNPVGHGIAWRGAFEAGIRAISVLVALQGLRESRALTPLRFERAVRMLAASAHYCWRDRSRFSSANNHLIGEMAGLTAVAILLPELRMAPRWEKRGIDTLAEQASKQILPDGAGAEQAVGYQIFTVELLTLVAALLRARGDEPPAAITAAVRRSASFLAAVVGDADPAPRYGDDDEGFALRLDTEPVRTVRHHLAIAAALTGQGDARDVGRDSLTTSWMTAMGVTREGQGPDSRPAAPTGNLVARAGGLVVLRSGARRVTMDVGPLGYLSIAAHGHADALAVTLSIDGHELVGDPGTASYYGHPDWRQVHRGTRVHPTVTVDGLDQSVIGGPFMWTRHANVRLHLVDPDAGRVDAEHDGYQRLPGSVIHRRWLVAPPESSVVLVVDLLDGDGVHDMCTSWPLHPSLNALSRSDGHDVTRDELPVLQMTYGGTGPVRVEQVRGDTRSNLGWWSDRLESRRPSWLVSGTVTGEVPLAMATMLQPSSGGGIDRISDVSLEVTEEDVVTSWRAAGRVSSVVLERRQRVAAPDFENRRSVRRPGRRGA